MARQVESFFGVLEQVDLHDTRELTIYDRLGNKIRCSFSNNKLSVVKASLGEYVNIIGFAMYREGEVIPYMVDIQYIEEYKKSKIKTNPKDLYGSHPDFGDGKTPAEIIREIRGREN